MFGAGMHVFAVWNYIIANSDAKGYAEINPRMIAATLGGTPTEVQSAIDYLSSSDENSRNPDEEGRRIVREGQFMYRIVSYMRYRDVRNAEAKKEYDRNYRREQRAQKKSSMSSDDVVKNTTVASESFKSSQVKVEVVNAISSNPSGSDDPEPSCSTQKADDEKAVRDVFAYYLQATDRNPKTYTLTLTRKRKGLARLRECLKRTDGNLENAVGLMKLAVDHLAASDFHMGRDVKTAGKRYCEWEGHLFGSYEQMERWWNE